MRSVRLGRQATRETAAKPIEPPSRRKLRFPGAAAGVRMARMGEHASQARTRAGGEVQQQVVSGTDPAALRTAVDLDQGADRHRLRRVTSATVESVITII